MGRTRERIAQHGDLTLPSDELRSDPLRHVWAEAGPGGDGLPGRDGYRLSLRLDRGRISELDLALRGSARRFVDEHPVHPSCGLEPRRRVHDVAGCHPFAAGGARVEPDERLAGRDADAELDRSLFSPLRDRERGSDRALGSSSWAAERRTGP